MRWVDSFTSASSVSADKALATHSRPGSSAGPARIAAARSHQPISTPAAASDGAIIHSRSTPWLVSQPAQSVLQVGQGQRVRGHRGTGDLLAQHVQRAELLGRDLVSGEPANRGQQRLARVLQRVDRADCGGRRIIDLVRQACSERAEGDQRLALPCSRLDGTRGPVEPLDEMPAQREPGAHPLTQHFGRYPQHPPGRRRAAGSKVDALVIPGTESARPAAGDIHLRDHGLLAADIADQLNNPLQQHPPEVGVLTLAEQLQSWTDANLGTSRHQLGKLLVSQAAEQIDRP